MKKHHFLIFLRFDYVLPVQTGKTKQRAAHPIREESTCGSGTKCKGSKETRGTKFQVQLAKRAAG